MLKEGLITAALAEVGYAKAKRLTYQASWSTTEVEHFLYLSTYGNPKEYLTVDFGLRNPLAEEFAIECISLFGGEIFRTLQYDRRNDCFMRFSLGKAAAWRPRWSLTLLQMSPASVASKIKTDVSELLLPLVRSVTTAKALLSLLLEDVEPYPWVRINSALRAAQIACLARLAGIESDQIRTLLRSFFDKIAADVGSGADANLYVEAIVRHSAKHFH